MQRRNFLASLAALFAVGKLPKADPFQTDVNTFFSNPIPKEDLYFHRQFRSWVRIEAGEPIDVGAVCYIGNDGKVYEDKTRGEISYKNPQGVCMLNNWPEDVVVALYD